MKSITIHKCKVCGQESEDEKTIQKCQDQGDKHKFSVGQEVNCKFAPRGTNVLIKATVKNINFEKRTHRVSYGIVNNDIKLHPSMRGTIITVPEEWLSSI